MGIERLELQPHHRIHRGIQGIKGRRDCLPIGDAATHDPKLAKGTDKTAAKDSHKPK